MDYNCNFFVGKTKVDEKITIKAKDQLKLL